MTQYIPKAAVVAEIEKRKKEAESNCGGYKSYDEHRCDACIVGFYEEFLEILNTLEVKEVDFEKVWKGYLGYSGDVSAISVKQIARHFFELGLYSQLTWQDIRLISEIGEEFMNSEESDNCTDDETYYSAILNKLKQLGRDYKTQRQEIRDKAQKRE